MKGKRFVCTVEATVTVEVPEGHDLDDEQIKELACSAVTQKHEVVIGRIGTGPHKDEGTDWAKVFAETSTDDVEIIEGKE